MKVYIINGPNLNFLGVREPEVYGEMTLEGLNSKIKQFAEKDGHSIVFFQSNHEGEIIDKIQEAHEVGADGIIINPAAFTHYSYAIHDALKGATPPAIEVHLSNIHTREEFRKISVTAPACIGQITGFGAEGYILSLIALEERLKI